MRTLELFSGAGGASEGLLAAGVQLIACVEYDPQAHATATAAGHPSVLGDVREVVRVWPGDLVDLLWASPPCQAFSSAGKRLGEADARNGWPWTLDAIDKVRPAWAICENVPGLLHHAGACKPRDGTTKGCAGCYWIGSVLPAFRARFPHVEVRTLDAADYGIPQHRKRVFLVAGPRAIVWPEPTHGPGRARPWVSIGEALGVPPGVSVVGGGGNPRAPGRADQRHYRDLTDEPSTTVAAVQVGNAGPFFVRTECLGASSSLPCPTVGTKANTYLHADDPGTRQAGDVLARPAYTVSATAVKGRSSASHVARHNRASDGWYEGTGIARLTVRQCAILQGIPDDYPWQGNQTEMYRCVGNAVVPRMAELLARAVLDADTQGTTKT